ncbi:Putative ribonuclease H protein At1g65750 [Linum perenne]
MQTSVLPITTCNAIDKRIRNFIWGSSETERKTHLVSWERICQPKENGGLGLKSARVLNRAYMTKLAFLFFQKKEPLWIRIIQSKYFKETNEEGVELVVGMHAPVDDSGDDEWAWGCSKDGQFTIKLAYALLCEEDGPSADALWETIWGWKGPNRIRHFLWLAGQDKLLTNDQRYRRKQADGSLWSSTREVWMLNLLKSARSLEFGVICWSLWKSRNARIFSSDNSSAAAVAFKAFAWSRTVEDAWNREARTQTGRNTRGSVEIAWDPGPPGWTTVNTDGAVNQESGKAAAGGLVRNSNGQCLGAFAMNIGYCSITRAELRGAIQGLRLAWDVGVRRVELQVDSMTVVQLIEPPNDPMHLHAMEVRDIRELLSRDWEVRVKHVYREANHAADHLAGSGFAFPLGIHSISPTDTNLVYFLRYDCFGISETRSIIMNN